MSEPAQQPVVHDEAWPIVLGPEIAGEAVSRREWLETNGLGGWAASTVSGAHSRRYHGLLVAAMDPPVGCLVMLSRREETIVVDVDGVSGNHDSVVRPNQLFALSPPFPLVESEWARRVLEVARQQLATSRGLRSLSPEDPQYRGHYGGDPLARDGAYHQGTVWGWLIGPCLTAWMRHSGAEGGPWRVRQQTASPIVCATAVSARSPRFSTAMRRTSPGAPRHGHGAWRGCCASFMNSTRS